ncbi:hypothetical protein F6R98_07285 [Candidatus Methylospira mobilis]|uniref:Uncharacterized protein n=1 Tax=Candidatus Methylospira mobilis TaxID=1808979 RepID=A0A5Q0BH42_9GAMM|nr:hypothetical protein [Candidatus Methylospira mobilis]QFY42452.1 hypothetical protein F6R98_07285 [Candidatus Methylospira mobilis]
MFKLSLVILFLLGAVGCASQEKLNALQDRVHALENRVVTAEGNITNVSSDVKKIDSDLNEHLAAVQHNILSVQTETQNEFRQINSRLISINKTTDAIRKKLYHPAKAKRTSTTAVQPGVQSPHSVEPH